MAEHKHIQGSTTSFSKYETTYNLATKGFTSKDIIDLNLSHINIKDGKVFISTNGKTVELTWEETQILSSYLSTYQAKIKEAQGILIYSKKAGVAPGRVTPDGIRLQLKIHLAKFHEGETLDSIGWHKGASTGKPAAAIASMDDVKKLLEEMKKGT